MKHILFVCHGNICRSPMAEFILKKMTRSEGVEPWFDIASAGVSNEEEGNPVYPLARRELAQHGIGCVGKVARQVTASDYDHYDMIICMDNHNRIDLERLFEGDPQNKISLIMNQLGEERDVADPWYTRNFRATWNDLYPACQALFNSLLPEAKRDLML